MKLTHIALAVCAGFVGAAAQAVTPAANIAISSGASASKGNLKIALTNRCPGQLAEFASGTNISTYVCAPAGSFANPNAPTAAEYNAAGSTNFTGTAFAELRLNVSGGSFTAICLLAGWPGGTSCPAADQYLSPSAGALQAPPVGSVVVGGLTDLEPLGFAAPVRAGVALPAVTESAQFGQTFGVAVSSELYTAMFNDQKNTGKLPAACNITDTALPECVPVIGKAQMAAIMSSNDTNAAYTNGANFLAPSTIAAGQPLKYARRVDTSGTQATAQQYFMGTQCLGGAALGVVAQGSSNVNAGTPVGAAMLVFGLGSTGNVRTVLGQPGFAIGVMSGENNQAGESWRWIRVGGMNMSQSATPGQGGVTFTNTATALDGRYDFWYLSRIVRPNNAAVAAFWTSVRTGLGAVPVNTTVGLFRTNETGFTRGNANSCTPVSSN
jgi:hypothetical protein